MEIFASVIICTHNPRADYLEEVLACLEAQMLPKEHWELLIVDNASSEQLNDKLRLGWHPFSRIARENKLGLTHARLRGIKESSADLLIFVDDDNALEQDYIENAVRISSNYTFLGAWGGLVQPKFEMPPPDWTKVFWPKLAITNFTTDRWSNLTSTIETTPSGAGMCVRRQVAELYYHSILNDAFRCQLDRTGTNLTSCGDTDLAWTSYQLGMGTGLFTSLKLKHLIPSSRLEEDYLLRLTEAMAYSSVILSVLRGLGYTDPDRSKARHILGNIRRRLTMNPRKLRFFEAKMRGEEKAFAELKAAGVKLPGIGQLNQLPVRTEI